MSQSKHPPCAASAAMKTGKTDGPWYSTLMPFEHHDSQRTQRFPHTCDVRQLAGEGAATLSTRSSVADYANPYLVVTRERSELFVYGGYAGEGSGAYVAKVDPESLCELWRVDLRVEGDSFDWPGVAGVHGNGFVYAIAGNLLAKIDPETAAHRTIHLPQHPGQGGAAYNGFVVASRGALIAKSLERGSSHGGSLVGLREVAASGIPSFLVAVDPDDLTILAVTETQETSVGRVTMAEHGGREYAYLPGVTRMWRYEFTGKAFILDETWNPVYVEKGEQPGTACGLLGQWVIVETDFLASVRPLRVWAFHVEDSDRRHWIEPFADGSRPLRDGAPSREFSKPAFDPENMRVYVADQYVGQVAALDFDAQAGFTRRWQALQRMESFWAVIGPRERRNVVGTNLTGPGQGPHGDHVVFRNADTGEELASSGVVDARPNPGIVSSGFQGRFYYLAVTSQKIVELTFASP